MVLFDVALFPARFRVKERYPELPNYKCLTVGLKRKYKPLDSLYSAESL